MKSSLALYIGCGLVLTGLLSGCGQPGALYLPKGPGKSGKAAQPATQPGSATVPVSNPGVSSEFEATPVIPPAQQ